MSNDDDLPAVLVSAVDVAAASEIIRELISDGVEPSQTNGAGAGHGDEATEPAGPEGRGVAWRLENKYYSAAVRLLAAPDRPARPAPRADLQAHLIYLTEDECLDESACARRSEAAAGWLARGAVRLAAARAAPRPRLAAWARAQRYELVPLAEPEPEPGGDDDSDGPEARGVARLREALHAHPWPGLVRRARDDAPPYFADEVSSEDSSNSSWGSWRGAGGGAGAGAGDGGGGGEEAGAVERAEQFAAALAALPAARGGGGGGGDAERRLRAEQLVGAFCRALGHPLPPPPPPAD